MIVQYFIKYYVKLFFPNSQNAKNPFRNFKLTPNVYLLEI